MYKFTKPLVVFAFLSTFSFRANAQWDLFSDLLNQFDVGTNQFFFDNLDSLNGNWNPNLNPSGDLFGDLDNNLLDSIPSGNLDSTYLLGLDAGLDTLLAHLPGFGLSGTDQDTLLGELDWINGIFNNNSDSLGGLFGQYHDSLALVPNYWDITVINSDSMHNEQLNYLQDSVNIIGGQSDPNGLGNFSHIFGNVFDVNIFPDIELAFGTQNSNLKYYNDKYGADAKIVRIGSVPRFDKTVSVGHDGIRPVFPIEARWHVDVSWTNEAHPTPQYGDEIVHNEGYSKGFNPLMMSGDFAIMATPGIGTLGNTSFKLITSLGTEFGTYAPSHSDYARPFTSNNKGFMTGLGAQVGAGFSFTTGAITAYSLATFTQGQALRSLKPYQYTSRRYEVGIRYGNIINVRYSTGYVSWQEFENRQAKINNQFTVGIILAELHH